MAKLKEKKSGDMDKRFKEFKTLGSKITEVNKQIAAGTTTLKKGLEGIPEQYQGIVSKQQDLNKLTEDGIESKKTWVGQFRDGIGLSLDENQLKAAGDELQTAITSGKQEDIDTAIEGMDKMNTLNKKQEEAYNDMQEFFPGIFSAIQAAGKAQAVWNMIANMNPYVAIAAVILAIAAALLMMFKQINAIREEFGLTIKESMRLNREIMQVNMKMKLFGISAEQVQASMGALANTFGEVSPAMVQFAGDMARVARNSGITAENAAQMVSLFQATHGVTKEVALDMIESTQQMAALTGLSPGVIMKEMVENADLFASHLGQSEQNLIAAVAQAKKLGMEFGELNEFGDGLLDVTERINKEQMLSAMLGKQVNLQKAAMLQAQGDEVGFMNELSSQLQGVGELTAQQRRLFSAELGIATADVMKLAGLQSGMAGKSANIPGQNPYEQARFKQGEKMLRAINQPAYQQ